MNQNIRVRFAPSPTGTLHIGGVRTALFNYLFARKEKGAFLLRIEDTDRERSRPEFEKEILDSLNWLGLHWDGSILKQSQRLGIYQKMVETLIQKGHAYSFEENGKKAVKFKAPNRSIQFQDLVHGLIRFEQNSFEDFVVQKSDGFPTYHFACVVDDHEMEITHVIRGDDHISNTPKQIAIYEALGWLPPQFGHLPLVFGQDKSPLSKRHGATALSAYHKEGYLPEAILNYLALLGWSSGGNQEIFSREELIEKFSLSGINKTNACFDSEKLKWVNSEHIRRLSDESYLSQIGAFFSEASFSKQKQFSPIALLYKGRIRTFSELLEHTGFFFEQQLVFDPQAVHKHLSADQTRQHLEEWKKVLEKEGDFSNPSVLETLLRQTSERLGINAGALIHPTRVAISGRSVTPGLFEVMALLGKDVVIERMQYAIMHFKQLIGPTNE